MPPAIIAFGVVASGAVAAATMGYIAVGVTVAGLVTGNKTLQKIGGQLGLGAGLGGIATSFMGAAGSAASGSLTPEAANSFGAESASGATQPIGLDPTTSLRGTDAVPFDAAPNYKGEMPQTILPKAPPGYGDVGGDQSAFNSLKYGPGAQDAPAAGTPGADIGATQGTGQGNFKVSTPYDEIKGQNIGGDVGNVPNPNTPTGKADAGYFDFLKGKDGKLTDTSKMMIMEGGKIVAGGLQGMAATSNANTQLEENRRVGDIQRANAASIGRSTYGLMSR